MEYLENTDIATRRSYKVVKANEIIQKAKYELTLQELKIMSYCFSMIKPNDTNDTEYTFSIIEFCKVCGIDYDNGKNYQNIKKCFTKLLSKVFWIQEEDGSEVSIHWIQKTRINRGKGKIDIKFDEDLQKYIFGLLENYTQYELLCTLPMSSQYSFRLYELLKSYAFTKKHKFKTENLKQLLNASHYENFKDFRRKALEIAIKEINLYTDIEVMYEPITKGRKVIEVYFVINQKDSWGRFEASLKATEQLEGQMNIADYLGTDNV